MVIYHPKITISQIVSGTSQSANVYDVEIDAPSFDGVLSDLNQMCKEILAAHIQYFVDNNVTLFPLHASVRYDVMGLYKEFEHIVNKEEFESLKKAQVPDKPKLNEESLLNDIQYGINMIRSVVDIKKDVAMFGVINWYYHLLLKHFGLMIPTEITEIYDDLRQK